MYNPNHSVSRNVRVAVGNNGRMHAAALIAAGRARRVAVGRVGVGSAMPPMQCPGGTSVVCKPPVTVCPENQKRIVLPFVPDSGYTASVTAGSEVRFVAFPQNMFKPERMIIASSIAPFFDIVNFSIGNSPQSVATGNYSAEMYSEVSTYTDMTFDQCYPGIQVILVAKNKSSVTQTFQAQLVGWADKP